MLSEIQPNEDSRIFLSTKVLTELCETRSFIRGLDIFQDLLFVGTSTIRQSSRAFADLPVSKEPSLAGVKVIDLNSGKVLATLNFSDRVHETFDVKIVPDIIRSTIYTPGDNQNFQGIMMPDDYNFWTREVKS